MPDLSRFIVMEKRLRPLTLAVQLKDRLVPNFNPVGKVEVALKNSERKSSRSASGAFTYLALPEGIYKVQIESDFYQRKEFDVTIPTHASPPGGEIPLDDDVTLIDLKNALAAEVKLNPEVNYPFPSGATLVYGEVVKVDAGLSRPLANAVIHVADVPKSPPDEKELQFKTNPQGRFALYMNKLTKPLIKEINGREFGGQRINGERRLVLRAVHPDFGENSEEVVVNDGQVSQVKIIF